MKNRLLFHLKSSFRSQDIYIFALTFWSCRKNDLIRKTRLISKFMTAQHTIIIHVEQYLAKRSLPVIREKFSFKNHAERLVPDYFLFFKKALYEVKATDLQLSFNIFAQPSKKVWE